MGSLRPSRSDAEIRQGSFSPCLVVGRPKSRKSRLVCFQSSRRLEREAGRNVEAMWLVVGSCSTTRRLSTGGSASAFAPARTRWLGNDKVFMPPKLDSNGGRERISQCQLRAH